MTTFFNILFFIHLFGMAGLRYLYYDSNRINNENIYKWILNFFGIKKKEEFEHSEAYLENLSYKNLFIETFPNFIFISKIIVLNYIISIFIYAFVRINIPDYIDSMFNMYTLFTALILIIVENFVLLAFIMPELKTRYYEICNFRPYFEPALRIFVYCSSYLISMSIICLLNYYVPSVGHEELTVKVNDVYKSLSINRGFYNEKLHNILIVKPEIYGKRFVSVSNDILIKAKRGDKLKVTVKEGFFGARFIENEELLK